MPSPVDQTVSSILDMAVTLPTMKKLGDALGMNLETLARRSARPERPPTIVIGTINSRAGRPAQAADKSYGHQDVSYPWLANFSVIRPPSRIQRDQVIDPL